MAQYVKRGYLRSAVDALIAARQRQVSRYVNGALLMLDDETLKSYGYNRDELRRKGAAYIGRVAAAFLFYQRFIWMVAHPSR
jgi:hypothetical protein